MHSLTSVTEPLLLANRELEFDAYQWRIVSQSGREIRSSLGLSVKADGSLTVVEKVRSHHCLRLLKYHH